MLTKVSFKRLNVLYNDYKTLKIIAKANKFLLIKFQIF